jgi:hypothetical protein
MSNYRAEVNAKTIRALRGGTALSESMERIGKRCSKQKLF